MTTPADGTETDLRGRVRSVIETQTFRMTILGVIFFNAIVLGLETSATVMALAGPLLVALDTACLAIFVVELAAKLYVQRARFFASGWNLFDAAIVSIAIMPAGEGLAVLRALRVLRVLRAISIAPTLRRVVQGFVAALPGMGSVIVLMSMIFYVGAVMATRLFGSTHPEWFGTIGESAYTLFQIMTLESWSMGIVRPVMEVFPWAWMVFVPFITMTAFAVLNLFIGILVNAMQSAVEAEQEEEMERLRDLVRSENAAVSEQIAALHEEIRRLGGELREARARGGQTDT